LRSFIVPGYLCPYSAYGKMWEPRDVMPKKMTFRYRMY